MYKVKLKTIYNRCINDHFYKKSSLNLVTSTIVIYLSNEAVGVRNVSRVEQSSSGFSWFLDVCLQPADCWAGSHDWENSKEIRGSVHISSETQGQTVHIISILFFQKQS